jgi:hypothetical protein
LVLRPHLLLLLRRTRRFHGLALRIKLDRAGPPAVLSVSAVIRIGPRLLPAQAFGDGRCVAAGFVTAAAGSPAGPCRL